METTLSQLNSESSWLTEELAAAAVAVAVDKHNDKCGHLVPRRG